MNALRLLILWIVFGATASAWARPQWEVAPLTLQSRFERGEDQSLNARNSSGFLLGAVWPQFAVLLEHASFGAVGGSSYSNVDRTHRELIAWLRKDFARWRLVSATAAVGAGAFQEDVTTRIAGFQSQDHGGVQPMGGLSVGLAVQWDLLRVSLDARAFFSAEMDPNPQPDVALRAGVVF